MSEEKLYMVKNDKAQYWDFNYADFWRLETAGCYETTTKEQAEIVADEQGGHIVTLIEEPEKVVLTKEQAEIVEEAHDASYPARYITDHTSVYDKDENLLMNAYVNGWTVKQPQRWYVKAPDNWGSNGKQRWLYKSVGTSAIQTIGGNGRERTPDEQFTEAEIEHYGLQGFEKEEVTDDEQ